MRHRWKLALAVVAGWAVPASAQIAQSTFDTDQDGWVFTNPADTQWVGSGGNPGGYIRVQDLANPNPDLLSPSKFLGSWSDLDGNGLLRVDHRVFDQGGCIFYLGWFAVSIGGPGGQAIWRDTFIPDEPTPWRTRWIPIAESSWTVQSGSWDAIVSHVTELVLYPELVGNNCGVEVNGVDNVILGKWLGFETFPDGTPVGSGTRVTDQWLSQGIRVVPLGGFWSARTVQEGQYGLVNFGNSAVTVCHVGDQCDATGIAFVSPGTGRLGSTSHISIRLGDGDPDSETCEIRVRDRWDNLLDETIVTTTGEGYTYEFSSVAADIAKVTLRLACDSPSGIGFDDVIYAKVLPICWADFNDDGSQNFFDVQAFLSAWSASDLAADVNGDWEINFFDVQNFLQAFSAGCP